MKNDSKQRAKPLCASCRFATLVCRGALLLPRIFTIVFLAASLVIGGSSLRAAALPSGFIESDILGYWPEVAGATFDSTGIMYVWERSGKIWIVENDIKATTPLLDISPEVGAYDDYGLLGFTLDPNFRQNGYIYLLYVVDHHHLANFGTANYSATANQYNRATIGRLTRYTARSSDNFRSVDPASRLVLVGETASTGFPMLFITHGIGSLVFGTDGTLLVSCGDGAALSDFGSDPASYYSQGLNEGIIRSAENVGAFRSQILNSLNGKIIRIDPATGNGLPSNPFYDSASPRSPKSRVWTLGLRNPFRMVLKPGTGSHFPSDGNPGVLYVGDVGYDVWEELDVVTGPGMNFGWPVFEGFSAGLDFNPTNQDAPNPLFGVNGCSKQYFSFRDLIKEASLSTPSWPNPCNTSQQIPSTIPRWVHSRPAIDWHHAGAGTGPARAGIYSNGLAAVVNIGAPNSPVAGPQFNGNCVIGGVWYSGTNFPAQYQNSYFFADVDAQWIKTIQADVDANPISVSNFATSAAAVVSLAVHPITGKMYYVLFYDGIRKITYIGGGNQPPTALATADKKYGTTPVTVQFTGNASIDPEGQTLNYSWNFGDGSAPSNTANPSHIFTATPGVPTKFTVTLTVTDSASQSASTNLIVSVNNTPPVVAITSPISGMLYSIVGEATYNLTANVTDTEHTDSQLLYQWQTLLHHNNHEHPNPVDTNHATTSITYPIGCDGNLYYYRFILTVTDPAGLSTVTEVDLYPNCSSSNTPPTISDIPNHTVAQNTATAALPFTVGDAELAAANLVVTAASSNPALVPNANLVLGGSAANRTITATPATGQSGTAIITVTVNDGSLTASDTFTLTVNAAGNTTPTISNIADQTIAQEAATGAIGFTISDAETTAASLTVSGTSSNPSLVPNANIVLGGSGANRIVTVTPAVGQSGTATITVAVSDGALTANDTFLVTVTPGGAVTYLFSEGFEGTGFENTGWSKSGTPNENYTTISLHAAQALNCVGNQHVWRVFQYPTSFNLYFRVRWNIWSDYNNIVYWDNVNYDTAAMVYGDNNRMQLVHGSAVANGTTTLTTNVTYHVWVEWTKGTAANGTMKLFIASTGTKPASPEASITTGSGTATERIYVGPTGAGPNAIFDRILVDDVPIGNVLDSNQAPTISDIANQSIAQNTVTTALPFTVGDAETAAASLTVSSTSSNPTLVPNASIVFGGSGANRTVTVTPVVGQTGTATITVSVSDGALSASDSFLLSVNAANNAPTISDIVNQTISEDAATGALSFTVGDAETAAASLTVSASSSNTSLVPNANLVFGGSGANRTLTVTPLANQSGAATITITVSDGTLSTSDTFLLAVNAVNDTPTISSIVAQTINEDAATSALAFTVSDTETAAASLVVTGTSSSTALVPNANILLGGSGANRTVTVTPLADQSGTTTISLTVSDGTLTATTAFVVTVNAINDAPAISDIANQSIAQNTATAALPFTAGDVETAAASLVVTATSANLTLVPNANILLGGSGANRTVTVTPAGNQTGSATVTVTVSDGSLTASDSFVLNVSSSNTTPTISDIVNQAVNEDTATAALTFTIADLETAATSLTVTATSSNPALVPNANVLLGGSGANRSVTLTPAANQFGSATITVVVNDGSLTATDTFVLTVNAVNDAPTISDIVNQAIPQDTATAALPFTVGDLEIAASSLTVTAASANPTLVPNANILLGGSGANRTVTVTPAAGQTGTATLTLTVSDSTATTTDTFTLTVTATNSAATYLLSEGFEGAGYENTGWTESGAPNENYTATVLHGSQSLNCSGSQHAWRTFQNSTNFNLYFRVRWNTWRDYANIMYWDNASFGTAAIIYAGDNRIQLTHGTVSGTGTTVLAANVTYHVWVDWTKGTGANGTMKLHISTTGIKPPSPEVNITTGTGSATQRLYLGPTATGPNVIFDRLLIDDAPIGSNP